MSKIIEGVPDTITREQYLSLIESLGLDPSRLADLRFGAEGIYATVVATPPGQFDGPPPAYIDNSDPTSVARHFIYIRVVD